MLKFEDKGFSLIEVMVAVVILGIITIPIGNLFSVSLKNTVDSKEQFIANQIGQYYLEEMKGMTVTQISNLPSPIQSTVFSSDYYVERQIHVVYSDFEFPASTLQSDDQFDCIIEVNDSSVKIKNGDVLTNDISTNKEFNIICQSDGNISITGASSTIVGGNNRIKILSTGTDKTKIEKVKFHIKNQLPTGIVEVYRVNSTDAIPKVLSEITGEGIRVFLLAESPEVTYSLYNIDVTVSKDGSEITKLSTTKMGE